MSIMHDIFFFTDIHGMYDLYRAIMDYCIEQDPECVIIFGGDACDRGKDGYKIMKELLVNPRVIYLKGNHEDIFVKAAKEIKKHFKFTDMTREEIIDELGLTLYDMDEFPYTSNSIYNGGLNTLTDWVCDGMSMDFVEEIDNLQYTASYNDIDMCHAGGIYRVFKEVQAAEYNNEKISEANKDFILWDRGALEQGWSPERTCIFGHTPVIYLSTKYYGKDKSLANAHPCAYIGDFNDKHNGRKIDMDTCACGNGLAYVININTLKAQGFQDTEYLNDEIHKHEIKKINCIQM